MTASIGPRPATPLREKLARGLALVALTSALVLAFVRIVLPPLGAEERPSVVVATAPTDESGDSAAVRTARQLASAIAATPFGFDTTPQLVTVTSVPSAGTRAVLSALHDAGQSVRWTDARPLSERAVMAFATTRDVAPQSGVMLHAQVEISNDSALTSTGTLVIRDGVGALDSIALTRGSAALSVRAVRVQAPVRAELMVAGKRIAEASVMDASAPNVRGVRIFARPGWEAKFTTAALEEAGWTVDGSLTISPTARVSMGAASAKAARALDTAQHSVAIVLDSGVVAARVLERFVQQGGGVVIAGSALRDAGLASLVSSHIEDERPAIAGALLTDEPRRGLAAYVLRATPAASVLEREDAKPLVLASRVGAGRVVLSGYRDTWHWRMEGRDESAEAHRRWWNSLASAVAYSPSAADRQASLEASFPGDAAPTADLYARLGEPLAAGASTTTSRVPHTPRIPLWLLITIASAALLVEWASRRLRGAP